MKYIISLTSFIVIGLNVIIGLFEAIKTGNIPSIFILIVVLITLLFIIALLKYIKDSEFDEEK